MPMCRQRSKSVGRQTWGYAQQAQSLGKGASASGGKSMFSSVDASRDAATDQEEDDRRASGEDHECYPAWEVLSCLGSAVLPGRSYC